MLGGNCVSMRRLDVTSSLQLLVPIISFVPSTSSIVVGHISVYHVVGGGRDVGEGIPFLTTKFSL